MSAEIEAILSKFGIVKWFDLLGVSDVKNLIILKSKITAAAILNNPKIAISRSRFERFR